MIDSWNGIVKIGSSGTSLVVRITEQARMLDLDRGDVVQITIKKIEEGTDD